MYATSINIDDLIDDLKTFLTPFVSGAEIVQAQSNRVPMPHSPCVILTPIITSDIETPNVTYNSGDPDEEIAGSATITGPKRADIQIDFYGESSGDQCNAVKTVFRSGYSAFSSRFSPLYCSDGIQSPMISGEQQWEARWTLTSSFQYNPQVQLPQDFADELEPQSMAVDIQ